MFSFCPYSWPQLLLRSIVLVQEPITRLAPAQGVPTPLFSSMFSVAFLVSFSRLVPRLTAPHVGFGLVLYAEHAHFHRLRRTCLLIFSIPALKLLRISSLDTRMGQWTFKILLRHVWRKVSSLSSWAFVILHVSPRYNRIAMIFDLKILFLVSRRSSHVLRTFESRWKTKFYPTYSGCPLQRHPSCYQRPLDRQSYLYPQHQCYLALCDLLNVSWHWV